MSLTESEFQLVLTRAREKDQDAFAQLFTILSQSLLRYVRYGLEVENKADAEDIALDTWEQAWHQISEFPPFLPPTENSFLWWLRKMARSLVASYRERQKQIEQVEEFSVWAIELYHIPEAQITQFTVYHPKQVEPQTWSTMLFYAHSSDALESVQLDSEVRLGFHKQEYEAQIPRIADRIEPGQELRVQPEVPGFQFDPPVARFLWCEDWHCVEFRFRYKTSIPSGCRPLESVGYVSVHVGPLLIAEVRIAIMVGPLPKPSSPRARTRVSQSPYEVVFASYAHADTSIVEILEAAYRALGLRYLRDVNLLRSGEEWRVELKRGIDTADVFQLFWSRNAKESPNVEKEWRYAHSLHRPAFIRPLYWETPMPDPPEELKELHFHFFSVP